MLDVICMTNGLFGLPGPNPSTLPRLISRALIKYSNRSASSRSLGVYEQSTKHLPHPSHTTISIILYLYNIRNLVLDIHQLPFTICRLAQSLHLLHPSPTCQPQQHL